MFQSNTASSLVPMTVPWSVPQPSVNYGCGFIHQLQGNYIMETANGFDRIHVLSPNPKDDSREVKFCLVRCTNSFGVALQDQRIFEEPTTFVLCSSQQVAIAWTSNVLDMRSGVCWINTKTGYCVFWKRIGHRRINETHVTSFNPTHQQLLGKFSAGSNNYKISQGNPSSLTCHQERENDEQKFFNIIKYICTGRPNLVKKVVLWGLRADASSNAVFKINPRRIQELSRGKFWVTCMLGHSKIGLKKVFMDSKHDALDDIKGAYQEVEENPGIYVQPRLDQYEQGRQHRLRLETGKWTIEHHDPITDDWHVRAKQQCGTRWLEMKDFSTIRLKLLPLKDILDRMVDESFHLEVDKLVNFLYESCNQKKLATKLTKRNIGHNITNLKTSLRKQRNLTFAVRVANKADEIAKEHGIYG